jgi:Type I restriction enzyme R protein N terminus (HSDR_N)
MTAPASVFTLVDRFHRDIAAYKSGLYNEAQARLEFIDPLFEALGWDIGNRQGAAAAYRDVVIEYSMKIGAATKAPDYLFRAGSEPKFFVEAKKPSVNVRDDISPAFQLRRYAWSATLPLSVLTDFEELAVYDCRVEPMKADKPSVARLLYIPYTEYADQWDSIAELFSREAVLSETGSCCGLLKLLRAYARLPANSDVQMPVSAAMRPDRIAATSAA